MLIGEQFFLAGLAVLLVQHAEFEVRHQHVFVVRGYKLRRFAAQHRRQTGQCQLIVQQLENKNETEKVRLQLEIAYAGSYLEIWSP